MTEQDKAEPVDTKKVTGRKKKIFVGAVCVIALLVLGAWFWKSYNARLLPVAKSSDPAVIGVVDLQSAMKAHSAYAELKKLYEERQSAAADIAMERQRSMLKAPEAEKKPFADVAQQKGDAVLAASQAQLMAGMQAAEQARRKETQADYLAAKKAIDDAYLNVIFNIRLKLDNADSMRLTQDDVDVLEASLSAKQKERGEEQRKLDDRYESAIRTYVNEVAHRMGGDIQAERKQTVEQIHSEEMKMQTAAQARNIEAMGKQTEEQGAGSQQMMEKRANLQSKAKEIEALEAHILRDIAGKAAKLAIMHHLTLILANPSVNLQAVDTGMLHVGAWPEKYELVVPVKTLDLTQELIDELK